MKRATWVLIAAWLVTLTALFRPELHGMDTVAYYSWLRSPLIDGDLQMADEFAALGFADERGVSPTGLTYNEWPVGSALLWAPFFLIAHGAILAVRWLTPLGELATLSPDGYTAPYLWAVGLGSSIYALFGLLIAQRLCRKVAGETAALWAVLSGLLSTPLLLYATAHPFMSHSCDLFANAAFLALCFRDRDTAWHWGSLGLVGGLAAAVRPQNATLLAIWAALQCARVVRSGNAELGRELRNVACVASGAVLGFLPQIAAWRIVFGRWLVLNPYGAVGAGSLDWRSPHMLQVLISPQAGLFSWTPVALLACWGLVRHLPRRHTHWALFIGLNTLAQVYIIGCWSAWHGAAAFGQRFLVNSMPGLCLGLAALAKDTQTTRAGRIAVPGIALILAAWNTVLLARYGLRDIPRMGPVTWEELVLGQFRFVLHLVGAGLDRIL